MEEAVDKALEKGKGNVMVDEVTEYENIWVVLGLHYMSLTLKERF